MATTKPRFSMTLDKDLLERITAFQKTAHYNRRNDAMIALMEIGLETYAKDINSSKALDTKRRLEGLRHDSHTRALLEASKDMSAKEIDQMTAFAEFLRRKK